MAAESLYLLVILGFAAKIRGSNRTQSDGAHSSIRQNADVSNRWNRDSIRQSYVRRTTLLDE
jgi:hypothetical protein